MAEAKETAVEKKPKKKDTLPTNCAQTNARIRRKNWYYRNGQYFASKAAARAYAVKKAEEKLKAEKEESDKAAAATAAAAKAASEKAEAAKAAAAAPAAEASS